MTITPIFRDYPIPIWETYPELTLWFIMDGILIFAVLLIAYLPRFLKWIDEIEKELIKNAEVQEEDN